MKMHEVLNQYDELINQTNKSINALRIYKTILEQEENQYLHQFFDKCLYTALNQIDLVIGLKYLDINNSLGNQIEANYFSRVVAHSSHEILNDLNNLSGKKIREYISINYSVDILIDIDTHISSLNNLKKENLNLLKEIRNNIFGHKEESALNQIEKILKVNNEKIYTVGYNIFLIQNKLLQSFLCLITKI